MLGGRTVRWSGNGMDDGSYYQIPGTAGPSRSGILMAELPTASEIISALQQHPELFKRVRDLMIYTCSVCEGAGNVSVGPGPEGRCGHCGGYGTLPPLIVREIVANGRARDTTFRVDMIVQNGSRGAVHEFLSRLLGPPRNL